MNNLGVITLPHHQTRAPPNTEEKTEMVKGSDLNLVRCSSSRRKKLKICTDLDSLPEELLIKILLHVPAQDLLDAAKFVSRRWLSIIKTHNFRLSHLHNSPSGLLIKHNEKSEHKFVSMTRAGQIEISSVLISHNPIKRGFWSSCNGLLLEPNLDRELMITNPVTKRSLELPPFISRTQIPDFLSALAFVPSRMEYKVVRTFYNRTPPYDHDPYFTVIPDPLSRIYCCVLIVGVDNSWRLVDTQHLSRADSRLLNMCPLVTEGFVHWVQDLSRNYDHIFVSDREAGTASALIHEAMKNKSIYFLTMNMETEIITHSLAPPWNDGCSYYKYFPAGGSCLSLLIGRGDLKCEVWEMDPEASREWRKVRDIDLEGHEGLILNQYHDIFKLDEEEYYDGCKLDPVGWLEYGSVIIFVILIYMQMSGLQRHFSRAGLRAAYNVRTRDISLFEFDLRNNNPCLVHTNSLMGIR